MSTPASTPAVHHAAHRRRVPRWVWFVVVCVALGAMTSMGVAWGAALASRTTPSFKQVAMGPLVPDSPSGTFALGVTDWDAHRGCRVVDFRAFNCAPMMDTVRPRPDLIEFERRSRDAACRRAIRRHLPLLSTPDAEWVVFSVRLAGWPVHCLAYEAACTAEQTQRAKAQAWVFNPKSGKWEQMVPSSVAIDPAFDLLPVYDAFEVGEYLLPTFPLWPGLLANTAFYGGAWVVVFCVPILLRRWRCARRGGCPQCGYSREGLKIDAPCPECGSTADGDSTPRGEQTAPAER